MRANTLLTRTYALFAGWLLMSGVGTLASAAEPALLELRLSGETVRGRLIAMDARHCLMMTQAGAVRHFPVKSIQKVTRVSPRFTPWRVIEVRDELRQELGKQFTCATTTHYVVCAQGDVARKYAKLFDTVYREFRSYFGSRGFRLPQPEFPLTAIVFPDPASFRQYAAQDGVRAVPGLMGYYLRTSNRVALFDPAGSRVSAQETWPLPLREQQRHPWVQGTIGREALEEVHASINADVASTMVHEATHQVAFNLGLHSRFGDNPKWVVEGLATVFEAPGIRDSALRRQLKHRVNLGRLRWFRQKTLPRRTGRSIADLVASDQLFRTHTLDAYAESWALSFFLIETRSSQYARYLKTIAGRSSQEPSTARQRLEDFQKAFGRDLAILDAQLQRFIDDLPLE